MAIIDILKGGTNMEKFIAIAVVAVVVILIFVMGYVKAPPNKIYIISGLRKRMISGKSSFKIPFFERLDVIDYSLMSVDVKTQESVPTADYINISVDAVVNIKVGDTPDLIRLASENFLNQKSDYVIGVAQQVLEGNTREIVGKMQLEEMVKDRQKFAELVKENAEPDLAAMGLTIISFNVQSFTDANGVIDDLGIDNIAKIKKNAAIAKAESERDIEKAQSLASKEANEARIESETQIAIRNNEMVIKKAELKKEADIKKAEADAAYQIQQEAQRKTIEVAIADANIAKQEREIELKSKEAEVMEKALEADIKKKAEADKFARQQKADAELYERQRLADAEKYEQLQQAEAARIKAEADKYTKQQEAEAIKSIGVAEAEAIRLKGLAEAEGIDKKAEAMAKMGQASVLQMYFEVLPEIAKNVAAPLSNIDKITMYGSGNTKNLVSDIIGSTTQIMDGLNESAGVDIQNILKQFLQSAPSLEEAAVTATEENKNEDEDK